MDEISAGLVAYWSNRKQKILEFLFMDMGSEGRLGSDKLLIWKPTPSSLSLLSDSRESLGSLNSMMFYLNVE